jgi:hypothetical protein
VKQSRRKGQLTPDEIWLLAFDATNVYFGLISLALKNGFTLKHEADRQAIFKHVASGAEISICMFTDEVPEEAREMLTKLIT